MAAEDHNKNQTPVYCLDTFSEKAKASSFYIERLETHLREHSFINNPHKHDHYLILYVTRGSGTHTIDFKTYDVRDRSLFVMTPGQVHSWKLDEGTDGIIIFFENAFRLESLGDFEVNPMIEPDDPELDMIVKAMHREKDIRILRAWLEVLLLKLSKYSAQQHAPASARDSASSTFKLRRLSQLIEKNFIKLKKPADYANLMNLSPAYLNNLCKKHLSKTLSDLINERVVLEGKRLFAYTDLTVAQVSNRLRFSEASYFIRFFRKNAGITPEQFKESTIRPIQ